MRSIIAIIFCRISIPAPAKRRASALAVIAASDQELGAGQAVAKRAEAEAFLARDTRPYHDGMTHIKPEYAAVYMRHGTGPYARLAPTLAQARAWADLA